MADVQVIGNVDAARQWLLENQDKVAGFDIKYGRGSAQAVLDGTYAPPQAPVEPQQEPSFLESMAEGISEFFQPDEEMSAALARRPRMSGTLADQNLGEQFADIGDGAVDVLQGIARGPLNAAAELQEVMVNSNSMNTDQANSLFEQSVTMREKALGRKLSPEEREEFAETFGVTLAASGVAVRDDYKDVDGQDIIDAVGLTDALQVDTTAGKLAEGFSQFLSGYVALGGGTSIAKGLVKGAVVDGTMFDPYEKNLSAILNEYDFIKDYIPDALATDANDEAWVNRMKMSTEGALLGGAIEGAVLVVKQYRNIAKAREEITKTGSVSDETSQALSDTERNIQSFSDLENKPKGSFVEGRFVTEDGMAFKPDGNRDLAYEAKTKKDPEVATGTASKPEAPAAPAKPEVQTTGPVRTEAQTVAPKLPELPSTIVNIDAMKAAIRARKNINPAEMVQIGDVDQMGNSLGLFNWDRMDGPVDAMKTMDQFQDELQRSGVLKAMGLHQTQTHEEVFNKALSEVKDITGADLPALRNQYLQAEKVTRESAERIVAGKMILQSTARHLNKLTDEVDLLAKTGDTNTELERKLVDMLQLHTDLQASVKGIQTATARATSAGRIRTADAVDDVVLDRLAAFGGSKKVQRLAKKLKTLQGDPKAQNKVIRKAVERTRLQKVMDVANEIWINNILSGYHTHFLNMGANTANLLIRPMIRTIGGTNPFAFNGQQIEEGLRQYIAISSEIAESFKAIATLGYHGGDSAFSNAMRSWWREEGVLDTASKFDPSGQGNGRAIATERGGVTGFTINSLGKFVRGAGRFLQAEDELFKQIAFRSRLKANVVTTARRMSDEDIAKAGYANRDDYIRGEIEKAINTKETLTEKWEDMVAMGKVVDDEAAKAEFIKRNLGTYNHASMYARNALDEARETTFTTPLRRGTFSKEIQDFLTQFPVLRQIMPFVQTPTNILRTSFERAPILNFAMKRQREIFKNGTPEEKAMLYGSQVMGAAAAFLAFKYATEGRITGGGPSYTNDVNKAKLWNASPDWQPYSVNIGTAENPKWLELRKMDPHGFMFGIIGDINEMFEYYGDTKDPEVIELVSMAVASFSNNIMDKTYMMGLSEAMRMFDGSAQPWELEGFLGNRVASAVPYAQFSYQYNQDQLGMQQELRSLTDKVKARVMGMNDAAVKVDWLTGERMDSPRYFMGFIRQKDLATEKQDIAELYEELRNLNHAFVGPQKNIGDIELSPEVYQRYNEILGTTRIRRLSLKDALLREIRSAKYAKLANEAEIAQLRSEDDPRVQRLNLFIQIYKEKAKAELYKEYPDLTRAVYENKAIRKSIQAGGDPSEQDNLIFEFPPRN